MEILLMLLLNIGIFAGIFYAFNRFLARSASKDKFLTHKNVAGWDKNPYAEESPLEALMDNMAEKSLGATNVYIKNLEHRPYAGKQGLGAGYDNQDN